MKELRQQAIRLLARREYTHAELRKKLAAAADSSEDVDTVLEDLAARGLLSDARAAASYLRTHGERFGAARLRRDLRDKGVDGDTIAEGLQRSELADEFTRACNVWQRKYGATPRDAREWARQARFLQSRGFSSDIIRRLLKAQDPE